MKYTVKKLSKLSGVSIRTLHFYDEIGILKPAYYGENKYRYYEEEQVLMLQQILLFKELGFPLSDIEKIVHKGDFDKLNALRSHKKILLENFKKAEQLLETIDRTIAKLEGRIDMEPKEMFVGFDAEKQKQYEQELVDRYGDGAKKHIEESKKRTQKWSKADWERIGKEGAQVLLDLVHQIQKGSPKSDPEVQKLIRLHYQWICHFWTPNQEAYIGLGRLYADHPDFRKFYEPYHPLMADYLCDAMRFFAEKELI